MNENIVVKSATTATYGGSATAVIFGLSANEFAALGGFVVALIGLVVAIYYKHQHLKIAKQALKANKEE
jgi:small neutral amino acid transporter SnatA (MarC family)